MCLTKGRVTRTVPRVMRTLYNFALSPACRVLRVALAEKGLEVDVRAERVWERRPEFLSINPAGDVPVLVEPDGTTLTDLWVATEYLEEVYPSPTLLGGDPLSRAETRRLIVWFDHRFGREVTDNLLGQKVLTRIMRSGHPNSQAIRAGKENIHYHLDYLSYLADQRNWLAGDSLTYADIVAAAHISCVDYVGDVPWADYPSAKLWYARMKSRPTFRPMLDDLVPGVAPPAHYADPDF